MKTLITPRRAAEMAFGDGEQAPAGAITTNDLAAAETRYIVPVIGPALHEKLLAGSYPELLTDHLAPAAALFARVIAQPRIDLGTTPCGTTAPRSDYYQPAAEVQTRRLLRTLRNQARTLLRRAADYLKAHAADYPEYDDRANILNRCRIDGNFVQNF